MSQNKERWFGGLILLGGGALMATLLLQGKGEQTLTKPSESQAYQAIAPEDAAGNTASASSTTSTNTPPLSTTPSPEFRPLPLDIETENRMREIKRVEREKQVADQEAKTAAFLAQQQQIEAQSAKMAADEQARKLAKAKANVIAEDIAPEQSSNNTTAQTAPTSNSSNVDTANKVAEAKAEAARLHQEEIRREAQKIVDAQQAKAKVQADKQLAAEKQKQDEQKRAAEKAAADAEKQRQKAAEEKARKDEQAKLDALVASKEVSAKDAAKLKADTQTTGEKQWMVQVALSVTPSATDSLVAKLRAKGYKVVTSKTTKGTRILVGPQKSKEQSAEVNHKIVSDPSLNVSGSWVINWQPLTP